MQTPNEVNDYNKLNSIRESLAANGWQGAPLVKWGAEDLITGSHRYTAAKSLDMLDCEIPMIDLEEVFTEAGLNFNALHEEYGAPALDEIWGSGLFNVLPINIINKYGIQY